MSDGDATGGRLTDLARNYRVGFLRYLPGHEEAALAAIYDLGRQAMSDRVSLLELVRIHHEVVRAVVAETPTAQIDEVLASAAEFLSEALAASDMVQRRFGDQDAPPTDETR